MGGKSETGLITIGLGGATILLAIVSVALRFWVRIFTKAGLKSDDWLILASVLLTLGTVGLLVWDNSIDTSGAYVLDNENPSDNITAKDWLYKKVTWTIAIMYFAIVSTTKLGILLMYDRLFNAKRAFHRQIIALSAIVVAFWVSCTVASLTNFIPNLFDLKYCRYKGGALQQFGCFDYNLLWVSAGAIEVVLDLLILALPVQVIVGLQMSTKQKITLSALFMMGAFVVITGLIKTVQGYVPGSGFPSYSKTEIWSTVHVSVALISSCLPIFKPLVVRVGSSSAVRWLPSLMTSFKNGSFHKRNPSAESV